MKFYKTLLPAAALFMIAATPASENCTLSKDYSVTINGTSNLHSWDEKVETVTGTGSVTPNSDGSYDIDAINMNMEVHSIKSDMGPAMNNNTYKALKADVHPQITFVLTAPVKSVKAGITATAISAKCNLTIAGVTKPVIMQVKISVPQKGTMHFEGAQTIKMTDFGVTPPIALFGALVTGDEITIHFKTNFSVNINQ
jgi:polyisoprenoid-binding protein YceI